MKSTISPLPWHRKTQENPDGIRYLGRAVAPEREMREGRRGGRCTKNEKSLDFSRLLLVGLVGLEPMSAIRNRVSAFAFACRKPFAYWAFASLHHPLGALGSGPPTIVGTTVLRPPIHTKKPPIKGGFVLVGLVGLEPMTPTMSTWCSNQLSYNPKRGTDRIIA